MLTRVDASPVMTIDLAANFEQWLSVLVDIINENYTTIEADLTSLSDRITALGG